MGAPAVCLFASVISVGPAFSCLAFFLVFLDCFQERERERESVCVCVCVCARARARMWCAYIVHHISKYLYISINMLYILHIYTYIICVNIYIHTCVWCAWVCTHVHICICICVCMQMCVCVRRCMYTHTHTHTHTHIYTWIDRYM